jgi:MFS family permease
MSKKRLPTALLIWFGAVLFYLYVYVLRTSPSIMKEDMMSAFDITAIGFSSLSSFALYSYALMQIPMGMMVDHYGTRRIVLASIFLCVSGVGIFASSEQLIFAYIGRFMMGAGSACAFLSVSKIINEWFPDSLKGVMMGLTATAGTIGAISGQGPLVSLIEHQGWRTSLLIIMGMGCLVFLLNSLFLPKAHKGEKEETPGEEHSSFKKVMMVFRSSQAWIYALVAVGIYLSIAVVADLWGVSFLEEKFDIDKQSAADMMRYMYIGTALGCPLFAWFAQAIGSVRKTIFMGGLVMVGLLAYLIFVPNIPTWTANSIIFLIGICTGAEILCFIAATQLFEPAVAATMTGFLNGVVSLFAAIIQQNVGLVLDWFWDGVMTAEGLRSYSIYTYHVAFGVILFITCLSVILAFFIREQKEIKENKTQPSIA